MKHLKYFKENINIGNFDWEEIDENEDDDIIALDIIQIISEESGSKNVNLNTNICNDIGLDSLDFVNIIMKIEFNYNIILPDMDIIRVKTVKDLIDLTKNRMLD